ncbi:N-acetylglucosamine-specific PTS system, EIICBA component [Proteus penneri]|nr:N-acetylglucosamine-specific PTS system, EIICBA component [Proteus penneri]
MLPLAWITLFFWPKVQIGIQSLQVFMVESGSLGVWIYTFLERILIPTGLHHFIYGPFIFGPAVTEHGIQVDWAQNMQYFSQSTQSLKELFPEGGFALHGNSKVFGSIGIALALYFTAAPKNRAKIAGLLIPSALTAVFVGITEPLEFTFLFISPLLFAIHAVLAATLATTLYHFGVVGNMGGGIIDNFLPMNWIPMFHNHYGMIITQIVIGLIFTMIWFVVFRTLIIKLNLKTPGREEDDEEIKLYSKQDYKNKKSQTSDSSKTEKEDRKLALPKGILEGLGGSKNIKSLNNCATRLRIEVIDNEIVETDAYFKGLGVHGVVRKGHALQIIIGLHVSQVRDKIEQLMKEDTQNITLSEAI